MRARMTKIKSFLPYIRKLEKEGRVCVPEGIYYFTPKKDLGKETVEPHLRQLPIKVSTKSLEV